MRALHWEAASGLTSTLSPSSAAVQARLVVSVKGLNSPNGFIPRKIPIPEARPSRNSPSLSLGGNGVLCS